MSPTPAPGVRAARSAALSLTPLLLLMAPVYLTGAQAYPEEEAATLDARVEAAWHEPQDVAPGQQWEGFLRLRPGHNVTNASYQICNAGRSATCFAPPTPAAWLDERTLAFDTNDYLVNGRPIRWEAGWLIGVRWCLVQDDFEGCQWLPGQDGDTIASHYLTFPMPAAPERAPSLPLATLVVALGALAAARRR